jgi:hypothetical protein
MKNLAVLTLFTITLLSCGESTAPEPSTSTVNPTEGDHSESAADTAQIKTGEPEITAPEVTPNQSVAALLPLFLETQEFPFNPGEWEDEWSALEEMEPMNTSAVKLLSANLFESDFSGSVHWNLESFYRLDSLQENGLYDTYLETIDVGMTMNSSARALYKHDLSNGVQVLTWMVDYSTKEACPYAAGTICVATVVKDGNVVSSTLLNELMRQSDSPVGMSRELRGHLDADGIITLNLTESETDVDQVSEEEIIIESESDFSLKIGDDGIISAITE